MPKLLVIVGSTRPGRVGSALARWITDRASEQGAFEAELVELADLALPLIDEPAHPRFQRYEHAHTKRWSAKVDGADAFVFVVPEYNHGPPPALINAMDYLAREWAYKPVGMMSYGGVSGGIRSVAHLLPMLSVLKMVALPEAVVVPFVAKSVNEGAFEPSDIQVGAAKTMLDELVRWTGALKTLRS